MMSYQICRNATWLLILTFTVALSGCSMVGSEGPEVTGTYVGTEMLVVGDTASYDALEGDGYFEMTLYDDNTVDGRFFIPDLPGAYEGGEIVKEYQFGGSFKVEDDSVYFRHGVDTFIRDVAWTYDEGTGRLLTEFYDKSDGWQISVIMESR